MPGILGSTTMNEIYPTLPTDAPARNDSRWNEYGLYSYYGLLDPYALVGWESLVTTLQSADARYKLGSTIFLVPYDWRMGIDDIAKIYLKPWIDEAKEKTGTDTVNIIAHSMGGLVTRAYIQSSGYEKDIGKFAMVGTPNYGAGMAYYIWEGGDPGLADGLNGAWYDSILPGHDFYSSTLSNI